MNSFANAGVPSKLGVKRCRERMGQMGGFNIFEI